MVLSKDDRLENWARYYKKAAAEGTELMWPCETLVRLFKGDYVPGLDQEFAGKKVLEVGVGNGNNMIFLATLGLQMYGTEVTAELCRTVGARLADLGMALDLRVGLNRALPFEDDEFDFLVSWNVIHYEDDEPSMRQAIAEYQRVLKPGGRFFLSTTGPEHRILKNSATLGGHRYRIGREDDFRRGQVFFYFDAPNYIHYYFSQHFAQVAVGRSQENLFTEKLDYFIVTGVKG